MIVEIGFAVVSIAALIVTAGTAAGGTVAAQTAGRSLLRAGGAAAARSIAQAAKASIRRIIQRFSTYSWKKTLRLFTKKQLINSARSFARSEAETAAENAMLAGVRTMCMEITETLAEAEEPSGFQPEDLDITGIHAASEACLGPGESTMACRAAVVSAVGTFDPTGLLGVASAFMHADCEPTPGGVNIDCNLPENAAHADCCNLLDLSMEDYYAAGADASCPAGKTITSPEACKDAFEHISGKGGFASRRRSEFALDRCTNTGPMHDNDATRRRMHYNGHYDNIPQGCSLRVSDALWFFNNHASTQTHHNFKPVCVNNRRRRRVVYATDAPTHPTPPPTLAPTRQPTHFWRRRRRYSIFG